MWSLRISDQGEDRPAGELLCGFEKLFNPSCIFLISEVMAIIIVAANLE